MSNLCCVLSPALKCDECKQDVCQACIKIYIAAAIYSILTSSRGKRGISWLCDTCLRKRS